MNYIKLLSTLFTFIVSFSIYSQWQGQGNCFLGSSFDKLGSKNSIALDSTGNTLAMGSPFNSDFGPYSGYVEVYDWDGSTWIQRGNRLIGDSITLEGFGAAVSLSADGNTLAVGVFNGKNSLGYRCGVVKIYDWDGSTWDLRGTIEGEGNPSPLLETDAFGSAIDLSPDGNKIVIGGPSNTKLAGTLQIQGHCRVYHWSGTSFVQIGDDIDGSNALEEFGEDVAINSAGDKIVVGIPEYSQNIGEGGAVVSFQWNGNSWVQAGDTLFGLFQQDQFGKSVSMTPDGLSIIIGVPQLTNGAVLVFDWNGNNWVQRGLSIVGSNSRAGGDVDISYDGNIIAIGEYGANFSDGQVRVFKWNGGSWIQVSNSITTTGSTIAFGSSVALNAWGNIMAGGAIGDDTNGLSSGKVCVFENMEVASLNESETPFFSIHPNPSNGSFNISCNSNIHMIQVLDYSGRIVREENVDSKQFLCDSQKLESGVYVINILTENGNYSTRIQIL